MTKLCLQQYCRCSEASNSLSSTVPTKLWVPPPPNRQRFRSRKKQNENKDDLGGKQELEEVAENLRHWKDNCGALGYDSDGEQLSLASPAPDGSEDRDEVALRRAEASVLMFPKIVGWGHRVLRRAAGFLIGRHIGYRVFG